MAVIRSTPSGWLQETTSTVTRVTPFGWVQETSGVTAVTVTPGVGAVTVAGLAATLLKELARSIGLGASSVAGLIPVVSIAAEGTTVTPVIGYLRTSGRP